MYVGSDSRPERLTSLKAAVASDKHLKARLTTMMTPPKKDAAWKRIGQVILLVIWSARFPALALMARQAASFNLTMCRHLNGFRQQKGAAPWLGCRGRAGRWITSTCRTGSLSEGAAHRRTGAPGAEVRVQLVTPREGSSERHAARHTGLDAWHGQDNL